MADGALAGDLREAVEEIQAYLSDQVPPLLVLDSAQLLLRQPAELGAQVVRAWVSSQRQTGTLAAGDFLFHAIKKLQLLAKLKLVDPDAWQGYLGEVVEALVAQVPGEARDGLRALLRQATSADTSVAAQVQLLHRPIGADAGSTVATVAAAAVAGAPAPAAAAPSGAATAELAAEVRRFNLLLSRFETTRATTGEQAGTGSDVQQLLVAAATAAQSQPELEQHLMSLNRAGLMTSVRLPELFHTLSQGLPNWWVGDEAAQPAYESAPVRAMQRIVDLTTDPAHAATQFRELLNTARDQMNAGALPRAVQVLDVARRLLADEKVDKSTADLMLASAHEEIDTAQLMAQTQQPSTLPVLRRFLNAYPGLTPHGLLLALDDEPDRSRRRLWIALLEAHGLPARQAALERLSGSLADASPIDGHRMWLQRNFLYLLHRIKPAAGDDPALEVRLCIRCAELQNPAPLVREALVALGVRKHPEAEAALVQRLQQMERALETPGASPHDAAELRRMLGLVVAGLARQATPTARRAIVDHGLSMRPALGDTLERLGELAAYDLADDFDLVERLLDALRAQLPMRVLGVNIRRAEGAHQILRALAGTRSASVRAVFMDLVKRFPDQPLGQAALQAMQSWSAPAAAPVTSTATGTIVISAPAPAAPAAGLSGDLDVFGLPELLQTLSQAESSGRLVLKDRSGRTFGEVQLDRGRVRDARVRRLPMPDAFYQLMEAVEPGTFEFTRTSGEPQPGGHDVMALLMEGMRRYDELQRARAVAPDHALLRPTGARPTPPPDEADGGFIRELWTRLRASATPLQCEEAVAADAYRIRSVLCHWLTEGALAVHAAADVAPP